MRVQIFFFPKFSIKVFAQCKVCSKELWVVRFFQICEIYYLQVIHKIYILPFLLLVMDRIPLCYYEISMSTSWWTDRVIDWLKRLTNCLALTNYPQYYWFMFPRLVLLYSYECGEKSIVLVIDSFHIIKIIIARVGQL